MNEIKISIVMPIYNVEKYLRKCFDSVLASTLREIEVIAVDDGATDSSGNIIDEYAQQDSRVVAIHKQNGGYGTAVNAGLKIAKGEYVAILETDDWVVPNMYEELYTSACKYNADCIKGNFYYCPNENENIKHNFIDTLPIEKPFILQEHPELLLLAPSIWSAIYKKEFLQKNNIFCIEKTTPYEDLPFACQVYSLAKSIVLIDKCLYHYRCEPKMQSSTIRKDRKLFKVIEQIKNTLELLDDLNSLDYTRETIFKHIYNSMVLFVNNIDKKYKSELFNDFGELFNSKYANGLKFECFNKNERFKTKLMKYKLYVFYKHYECIKSFIQNIFSMKKIHSHKVITILGIKIKLRK